MNKALNRWCRVGQLSDIPKQGARRVVHGQKTIAVFRTVDDKVFALEDNCPHKQGPLSQGIVHDDCVTCPLHNWVISLASGKAQGEDKGQVCAYATKIDGNEILLDLTSAR